MKGILRFFTSWVLFGVMVYAVLSIAQGTPQANFWDEETRKACAFIIALGGFMFSVFVAMVIEDSN
jgi:hypothetical protein